MRTLKWGTLLLLTPTGFKMARRQNWKNEKMSVLLVKQTFSLIFQLWRLPILKPFRDQRRNIPHFKGPIMLNLDFEAQGRGSTFTLCNDHLKKAISLGKLQKVSLICKGLYLIRNFRKGQRFITGECFIHWESFFIRKLFRKDYIDFVKGDKLNFLKKAYI